MHLWFMVYGVGIAAAIFIVKRSSFHSSLALLVDFFSVG